ncbi:hypothetical protein FLM48_17735 [Shewanella sp. Scap07]|uniref:hypothetical protein n=1 Tax=Shewanella sp. Scap07 TaxID=2589987 RepID=UPI0015BC15BC|nr:hypothetical protein [Shewanella sp. Scap07]QLE86749.1 hypothetical protein FLM48_17735 [Shewanella sp. Scap07]
MLDAVYRPTSSAGSALDEPERVYSVFAFQQLDDDEIARLRCHLYCPECQGLAYYRKASKDGKAACFGSRYHAADCLEFKPSSSRKLEEADAQIVNDIVLQHDAMQIDFNLAPSKQRQLHTSTKINRPLKPALTSQSPQSILADGESTPTTPVTNSQADDAKKQSELAKPKEGLQRLLHSLLRGSELQQSQLWVYTDEKYRWRAKNLFVNFADAEPTDNGAPRMYWGTLSHADKQLNWLNPAENKHIGIPIDAYQAKFKQRFNIDEASELAGAAIIVFGRCYWNKDKSRKIIQLWNKDIRRMHIILTED